MCGKRYKLVCTYCLLYEEMSAFFAVSHFDNAHRVAHSGCTECRLTFVAVISSFTHALVQFSRHIRVCLLVLCTVLLKLVSRRLLPLLEQVTEGPVSLSCEKPNDLCYYVYDNISIM